MPRLPREAAGRRRWQGGRGRRGTLWAEHQCLVTCPLPKFPLSATLRRRGCFQEKFAGEGRQPPGGGGRVGAGWGLLYEES